MTNPFPPPVPVVVPQIAEEFDSENPDAPTDVDDDGTPVGAADRDADILRSGGDVDES